MSEDLFVTIKSHYNTFTRAERNIADYILTQSKDVLYMTITELADACKVGDTSVFRFCRHLGKNGYQDFKVDLAQAISDAHTMPVLTNCIVSGSDSTEIMLQKVLNNNIAALKETYKLIDPITVKTTTEWLTNAQHICFFGVGASSISAQEANNRFLRVCPKTECLQDSRMQIVRASLMAPNDVAVFFSYSGSTSETVAIAKTARDAGAHTICISRFAKSPLAEVCDLLFLCGGNEGPLQSGNLSVKAAQSLLLEVLYIAYYQANPEQCNHYCQISAALMRQDKL